MRGDLKYQESVRLIQFYFLWRTPETVGREDLAPDAWVVGEKGAVSLVDKAYFR